MDFISLNSQSKPVELDTGESTNTVYYTLQMISN